MNRATSKHDLKDYNGSIEDCNKAIELDPDYASAYLFRTFTSKIFGKPVCSDYKKACELGSSLGCEWYKSECNSQLNNNSSSLTKEDYFTRGNSKIEKKDYQGAITDYTKAIELDPDYADAYINRGVVKDDLKDYYGAITDYTKAISLDPDYASAYNNRGVSKKNLKDYYGAIADYTKAISLDPDYASAYANRGIVKEKSGKPYCSDYKKACDLGKSDCCEWYNNQCR